MKHIAEKVKDGVLDLSKVDTDKLIDWSQNSNSTADKDKLGCEIMYRT